MCVRSRWIGIKRFVLNLGLIKAYSFIQSSSFFFFKRGFNYTSFSISLMEK